MENFSIFKEKYLCRIFRQCPQTDWYVPDLYRLCRIVNKSIPTSIFVPKFQLTIFMVHYKKWFQEIVFHLADRVPFPAKNDSKKTSKCYLYKYKLDFARFEIDKYNTGYRVSIQL